MATLSLRHVTKHFNDILIINDISLDVADREFVVIVGPSGCGKSTLIRMIAGLEEIGSGDVLIDGQRMNNVGPSDRGLAMVFQSYALYPHMTVRQNLSFALRLARVSKVARDQKVNEAARILQLEEYLDRKPGQLSGGQRQRVAIGRAIVRNPKIFLFDEPLSNLDAELRSKMRREFSRLHDELKATMIYVTHDQVEAMTVADRIVVLNKGRVEQVDTPSNIYRYPDSLFVARFMGSPPMNMLPGRVVGLESDSIVVELTGGVKIAGALLRPAGNLIGGVTVGIRPEGLRPDPVGPLAGVVTLVERLGALLLMHVDLGHGLMVIAQVSGFEDVRPHQQMRLALDSACCHIFDDAGRALLHGTHQPQ